MNLLLIDNKLPSLDVFINGINDNTKYITYDYSIETLSDLLTKISNLGQSSYSYLGFVFQDSGSIYDQLAFNEYFITINSSGNVLNNNVTNFISEIVSTYSIGTVDFLACNLLSYPIWKLFFENLETTNSIIVRASDDNTGNLFYGGNWILETTNEDIKLLYFTDSIDNWNHLLDNMPLAFNNGIIDSNGNLYWVGPNTGGQFGTGSSGDGATYGPFILNPTPFVGNISIPIRQIIASDQFCWVITNESENNFYTCGSNITGITFGTNRFKFSNKLSDNTTNIFGSGIKVEKISLSWSNGYTWAFGTIITNEPSNNIYLLGRYYSQIGSTTPSASTTTFTNPTNIGTFGPSNSAITGKKIVNATTCSRAGENVYGIIVLTDELTNNVYAHGNNGNFQLGLSSQTFYNWNNVTTGALNGKKVTALCSSQQTTMFLTTDSDNNMIYVGFNNAGQVGNGGNGVVSTPTQTTAFTGKFINFASLFTNSFVLTTENTNNLYASGTNTANSKGAPLLNTFSNTNFTGNPFSAKKVIYVTTFGQFSYALTDEAVNNYYAVGTGFNGPGTGRLRLSTTPDAGALLLLESFGNTYVN